MLRRFVPNPLFFGGRIGPALRDLPSPAFMQGLNGS